MLMPHAARAAFAAVIVAAAPVSAAEVAPAAVFDRTVQIVEERFFDPAGLDDFEVAVEKARAAGITAENLDASIDGILESLNASHTVRYTPDEIAYYELSDVFRFAIRRDAQRLYPATEGQPSYDGIGVVTAVIDGQTFVTDVYNGSPAAQAGVLVGDQVVSADGAPFAPVESFRGKAGETVMLAVRHTAGAEPEMIPVKVETLRATPSLVGAIEDSVRVIESGNRRIGYVRLWTYTTDRVTDVLYNELGQGRLRDIDGLILDLRSRWGGAPADAAETFVGGTADMTMTDRDGEISQANIRFSKPVVAIIDEGSRSGMEILAYSLKKHGIPLVGVNTAKDVVAGTGFLLPDDSLLILAVADVHVEGKRLEGVGVAPDIEVPFDIRFANGADPQFDAALEEMQRRLAADGEGG